ncbi:phosphodiester glycosidase family protein [Sporanaerobacter acetigenes]|uniref:phosphodiester glycosidase family protein n=1 Tax=Sporanaerobacter acetigenes TaxID=165813 RepID=UPI0010482206|nr:phosphodiester glycosidase family protein [Sporanaerobacter acetigenes]
MLKKGSRGQEVKELQQKLNTLGYSTNGVDGILGGGTERAIKQFQKDNNLVVDGIVGANTSARLNASSPKKSSSNTLYEVIKPNHYTTVVKIPKDNIKKVRVLDGQTKTMSSAYRGLKDKPDFMINGGLYWISKGKSYSLNLLFRDGKQINAGIYSRFGFIGYKDNSYKFANYKYSSDVLDILGGSPSLIVNGVISIDTKGFEKDKGIINYRHPRSAIGESNTHFFLVAVDGRKNGKGMTIKELANFMKGLGCINAINLDGGGSTRLMQGLKVLNNPLENRAVNNMIGVYLK